MPDVITIEPEPPDSPDASALVEELGACPPCGPYRDDPLSPCFELRLGPAEDGR